MFPIIVGGTFEGRGVGAAVFETSFSISSLELDTTRVGYSVLGKAYAFVIL
jgi:hypothetical protein